MEFVWRAALALFGLLLVRGFVYPRGWKRRSLVQFALALLGVACTVPLVQLGRDGLVALAIFGLLALFPYRAVAAVYLRARARRGMRQLASAWGGELSDDREAGLWQVRSQENGRKKWGGNVLTHIRSIDPRIRRSEVGYMLAFVIELEDEPPFQCSLMYGWKTPRYFEREWRSTYVMRSRRAAASLSDLLEGVDRGRDTGGRVDRLQRFPDLEGAREDLVAMGEDHQAFRAVFSGEILEEFHRVATQTYPFELNVTPTSVSVYTTYCDAEAQKNIVDLLEKLADQVSPRRESTAAA